MDIIEVLISEKKNLRDEILSIKKIIFSSLFSVIAIIGALFAYIIGKEGVDQFSFSKSYLLYFLILSQIEFLVAIFIFSLESTLRNLSAHISFIDDRINLHFEKRVLSWETNRKLFTTKFKGVEFICFIIIYLFFAVIFIIALIVNIIEVNINYEFNYFVFLLLQFIELAIIIFLSVKKYQEFDYVKQYFVELPEEIRAQTHEKESNKS